MSNVVIKAENLGKKFTIGHKAEQDRYATIRDVLMHNARGLWEKTKDMLHGKPIIQGDTLEEVWALNGASFEIREGESVGIIGRNGAGKSTLLKLLSRIMEPSSGWATIQGNMASLLEVGTGFHPELTGRENIFLNGAILGMGRSEIKRKFDNIVAFADIEKYLDTPVKRYSSGMYVRLAFAVAAHLEPEILVVDEVLAVGDIQFQKKCLNKMNEVARGGRTILFVSHNMGAISQLCERCIWLHEGKIRDEGPTTSIVAAYIRSGDASMGKGEVTFLPDSQKSAQLIKARVLDDAGGVQQNLDCDKPVNLELTFQINKQLPGLYGYLEISKSDGTVVMVSDSLDVQSNPLDNLEVGRYIIRIIIPPRTLGHGDYNVFLNFTSRTASKFNVDSPGIVLSFSLSDYKSMRGNDRHGFFSILLSWNVVKQSS